MDSRDHWDDMFDAEARPDHRSVLEVRGAGPRRGKATHNAPPRRTELYYDGLHVATILEYVDDDHDGRGFCGWYVAAGGDYAANYAEAEKKIRAELAR